MTNELEAKRTEREAFEALWSCYISKLQRIDDLKAQGRYGYQLRMPHKAAALAYQRLDAFCQAHGIATP